MNDARVIQVIVTELTLRGNGNDDPYRKITQYWTFDGKLLAEVDPWPQAPVTASAPNGFPLRDLSVALGR